MAPIIHKSIDQAAAHITRDGHSWSDQLGSPAGPITFAFRSTGAGSEKEDSFSRFSTAQIAAAEEALDLWSDVANVSFSRVGGTGYSNNATILFANYDEGEEDDGAAAFAHYASPGSTASSNAAGDVWVDQSATTNANVSLGANGFRILLHEIGHALGLQHPGNYNAGPDVEITYDGNAEYIEDSKQYSVMSYFGAAETGADHVSGSTIHAATPLLHDIAAIQRLYGANMTTRTGDTTYGFNSTAGRESFDIDSADEKVVFAVWDAGGKDTFDFSGYVEDQTITLAAGEFSDVGGLTKNVAIAKGATIEHAKGGYGDDHITGNAAANHLYGNQGDDDLFGGDGNDKLYGGDGDDEQYGGAGADEVVGNSGNDKLDGGEGNDTLTGGDGDDDLFGFGGVDQMTGGTGDDDLFGGDANDTLDGGTGNDGLDGGNGNDNMSGGTGNDVLVGGANNDTLSGGDGDDRHNGGAGADSMVGGLGNDTYYVDHISDTVSDSVTTYTPVPGALVGLPTQNNAGVDTIYADLASYTLGAFIEELKALRANPFAGTGNALDNWMQGHNAADTLRGLAGRDTLVGLGGRDVLYGGTEADLFKFISQADTGTTASSRDLIADFKPGLDHIDLSSIDARSDVSGNDQFSFINTAGFSGASGQLRYASTTTLGGASSTIIEGDTNGDRFADFQIELSGRLTLAASDFVL